MTDVPVALGDKPTHGGSPSLPSPRPPTAPEFFHVLAKPSGPICNLDCEYCFFLSKEALYPGDRFRMADEVLETYIRQVIESQAAPEVTIAWQGGEPTLMGVDFFRRALALADAVPPARTRRSQHTIQTNGTLLTDEWCELFDGARLPRRHQHRRPAARSTTRTASTSRATRRFDKVHARLRPPAAHGVDFNVLCTVNAANQDHPLEVYRFFRDELGARHIQFIPIVERDNDTGFQEGDTVTDRSVDPEAWGAFLIAVFDEWVRHDVGTVFVPHVRCRARVVARRPSQRCASSARRAATRSRSSTTATCTRATTSSSPTTCSATSPRRTWSSCSRRRSSGRSATPSATRCRSTAATATCASRATASARRTASP